MKDDFISSGRCISDLKAHLVLTTKYRRKVFTGQMINRLSEIFNDLCEKWGCKIVEFNAEEEYIHLLFQYLPQMELPKFIGNLKSISSRKIRGCLRIKENSLLAKFRYGRMRVSSPTFYL